MHLYRQLSTTTALMLGWQHNAVLQERQKSLTFMDKVRLMRQTKPNRQMSKTLVRRWKDKLSRVLNTKDSRRLKASYSHHLQMAEFGLDLWQMVEAASNKITITEKFFRQLMRISNRDLVQDCLKILIEDGSTQFKKKMKQLIDKGHTRSKKTKKLVTDMSAVTEKDEQLETETETVQATVSSVVYNDLLEKYSALEQETSDLKRKNEMLEEKLLQFQNGKGPSESNRETTTEEPGQKRHKRQKHELE